MSRDEAKPAMPNPNQRSRLSGITEEWEEWMAHRTREIYKATQNRDSPGYSWSYPKPKKG